MIQGKWSRLSPTQKTDIWNRWKAGQTLHEIGRVYGKWHNSIGSIFLSVVDDRVLAKVLCPAPPSANCRAEAPPHADRSSRGKKHQNANVRVATVELIFEFTQVRSI